MNTSENSPNTNPSEVSASAANTPEAGSVPNTNQTAVVETPVISLTEEQLKAKYAALEQEKAQVLAENERKLAEINAREHKVREEQAALAAIAEQKRREERKVLVLSLPNLFGVGDFMQVHRLIDDTLSEIKPAKAKTAKAPKAPRAAKAAAVPAAPRSRTGPLSPELRAKVIALLEKTGGREISAIRDQTGVSRQTIHAIRDEVIGKPVEGFRRRAPARPRRVAAKKKERAVTTPAVRNKIAAAMMDPRKDIKTLMKRYKVAESTLWAIRKRALVHNQTAAA